MDTKEIILQGANELFMRYGLKSVTMDDIASHVSVSKKTIYLHFKDKHELVTCIAQLHFDKQNADMQKISEESETPVDEMLKISKYIKSMFMQMNPTILYDLKKYHPKAWQVYQDHKQECMMDSIIANLDKGISQGYYRADINPAVLTHLRMQQVEWSFDTIIFPMEKFNPFEVQMQLFDHFLYGILSSKGRELLDKIMNDMNNNV